MAFLRCSIICSILTHLLLAHGHEHHGQEPLGNSDPSSFFKTRQGDPATQTWLEKYGKQIDQTFSGPLSFSHLPYTRCLEDATTAFDIALLGMPFDTAVTYRPGARFGPYAIRSGSRRQRELRGYTLAWKNNPYELGSKIIDCGDVRSRVKRCAVHSQPSVVSCRFP